jgi:DNA repair exonuclease SbcCD ATPase subunit
MHTINFKTVYIKNFLSVGEKPITVNFEKGMCLITGQNLDKPERSNGVGKSTIADAIHFALFGETIREIKKDLIPNYYTNGKTLVQITFDIGNDSYEIARTVNPTTTKLIKNTVDETKDTIANTNETIETLVRCTSKIFNNCISLGINSSNCFMNMKKSEKREYIESILDLDIFSEMTDICKTELSEERKLREGLSAKKETYESILEDYKKQKEEFENKKKKNISELEQKIKVLKEKIYILNQEIESLMEHLSVDHSEKINQAKSVLKIIEAKISETEKLIASKQSEIRSIQKNLNEIKENIDTCPSCLREIDESCKDHVENRKKEMLQQITNIENEIKKEKDKREKFLDKKSEAEKIIDNLQKKEKQSERDNSKKEQNKKLIEQINSSIDDIEKQIEKEINRTENFDKLIEENEKKKQDLEKKITESDKNIYILNNSKFILSDEGLKSVFISKIINLLNSKINHYLNKLDANSRINFDSYFEDTLTDSVGKVASYANLSGAEKKAVDLACMFSFMEMRELQNFPVFNFVLFDEIFDSSFDKKSVQLITDICEEISMNKCVFIISHRKDAIYSNNFKTLSLQKKNGITTVLEN